MLVQREYHQQPKLDQPAAKGDKARATWYAPPLAQIERWERSASFLREEALPCLGRWRKILATLNLQVSTASRIPSQLHLYRLWAWDVKRTHYPPFAVLLTRPTPFVIFLLQSTEGLC